MEENIKNDKIKTKWDFERRIDKKWVLINLGVKNRNEGRLHTFHLDS